MGLRFGNGLAVVGGVRYRSTKFKCDGFDDGFLDKTLAASCRFWNASLEAAEVSAGCRWTNKLSKTCPVGRSLLSPWPDQYNW